MLFEKKIPLKMIKIANVNLIKYFTSKSLIY